MEIEIDGLAKRYVSHWVFRNLTVNISTGTHLAVTGPNGSGKSTLMKIISGALYPSEGSVIYRMNDTRITPDTRYKHIAFAAPYAELIEEMTLPEAVRFHSRFRTFYPRVDTYEMFVRDLNFDFPSDQRIQFMSSGMKQRIRLAFAICTQSSLLLLDEPTSNLDESGILWYHELLDRFSQDRTVIIASNVESDLASCPVRLSMGN
jgi:ABC-type multidrug transport system ATPase subunit